MPSVIEQNIFVRFDDPDALVVEMFFEPIGFHQRLRRRVLRRLRSHKKENFRLLRQPGKGIYNFIAHAPASSAHLASGGLEYRVAHLSQVLATVSRRRGFFCDFLSRTGASRQEKPVWRDACATQSRRNRADKGEMIFQRSISAE